MHDGRVTVIGRYRLAQVRGDPELRELRLPERAAAGAPRRADRRDHAGDARSRVRGRLLQRGVLRPGLGAGAKIIEVNGRIASQFAPLLLGLHGRSSYDALFELALGEDPAWSVGAPDGVAVSYALRTFEDALVEAVPEPEPDLEILVRPGLRLSEQGVNDAQSYRLAIFTGFGETRAEAVARVPRARRSAQLPAGAGACSVTAARARRAPPGWRSRRRRRQRPAKASAAATAMPARKPSTEAARSSGAVWSTASGTASRRVHWRRRRARSRARSPPRP